ncbi:MAG TPA: hypothetical protein VM884_08070 [Flavisolibacter sp.]|nr:hypothetical protein [Flavisolibacter sp.]
MLKRLFFLSLVSLSTLLLQAQMLTGVWHGKMAKQNTEVKIIKNGDSITGTSYYYSSSKSYRRYTIKGYFDEGSNQVVWWDDQLVEERAGGLFSAPGKTPLAARADFNCPGGGVMKLDGTSTQKDKEDEQGQVHLQKTDRGPTFADEWDYVLDNYTTGTNDPFIIDSISKLPFYTKEIVVSFPTAKPKKPGMVLLPPPTENGKAAGPEPEKVVATTPKTIEQKFIVRTKKVFTTLPVEGDSVSLSFYDNAIVDGDSISLFLDGRMLFTHIKLTDKPHTVKLAVSDLGNASELTMVAENLGAIPPNTSYMVANVGGKRYTANLSSTEETSAVIKLVKR